MGGYFGVEQVATLPWNGWLLSRGMGGYFAVEYAEWPFCGFCEIQSPKERYRFIDRYYVCDLMGFDTYENFKKQYLVWIKESVESKVNTRNQQWTKSIAVGDRGFIEDVKHKLGVKGIGRKIREDDGMFELKEEAAPYGNDFYNEIETLSPKNTYYW